MKTFIKKRDDRRKRGGLKREALDKVAVSYCDNQGDIYGSVTPSRVIIMGDMEGSP